MSYLKLGNLRKTLSSYTFQYAIASVTMLSVVVMFVMLIVYGFFSYSFFHDMHSSLSSELQLVERSYHDQGVEGVAEFVEQRRREYQLNRFAYILVDQRLQYLAGDLLEWPDFSEYGDGWLSFEVRFLQSDGGSAGHSFVARSEQLPGGLQLLVARDFEVVEEYINLVVGILVRAFIVTVSMGVIGAFIIAWALQRRLDVVNQNIQTIMAGDLSERLVVIDSPSEIERLVVNLNNMLDRIEYLMDGVKRVSDAIAHDLRTPLTRLRNHITQVEKTCGDTDREKIGELVVEVDDMLTTFNALLRISRIEAGEKVAEKEVVALDHLVRDVVELYEPVAQDKKVSVDSRLASNVFVMGDKNLLFQAIANIVDNAIKYTPAGGRVEVLLRMLVRHDNDSDAPHEAIELLVSDTGCGIRGDNVEKVFRRFYREEESRGKQPGNGLGLSLVAAVMDKHAAQIKLGDNHPGLRFSVQFVAIEPHREMKNALLSDHSSSTVSRDVSMSRA